MVISVNCAGKCLCIIISYNTTVMFQAMGKKKKYVGGTTKFTFHTFQNRFIIYLLKIV